MRDTDLIVYTHLRNIQRSNSNIYDYSTLAEAHHIDRKNIQVKHKVFTWSNVISLTRILVVIPIIYLHATNGHQITLPLVILVIYGVFSDYLDGILARMNKTISELGKVLDPMADKVAAFALFAYVVWIGRIPFWFLVFSIVRDLLIVSGSLYIRHLRGKVPMSVMSGKISVNVMALYWLVAFFAPQAETALTYLLWISVAFMIYSFVDYAQRYYKIRKGADFN